jgi:hypothetical protein
MTVEDLRAINTGFPVSDAASPGGIFPMLSREITCFPWLGGMERRKAMYSVYVRIITVD